MRLSSTAAYVMTLLVSLALTSCGEEDLTSIHIALNSDHSGTIRTSGISVPTQSSAGEQEIQGVSWTDRMRLEASQGQFTSPESLDIAGVRLRIAQNRHDTLLVVTIPMNDPEWSRILAPSPDKTAAATRAFDPSGRTKTIGKTLKISIDTPHDVLTTHASPWTDGVSTSSKGRSATIYLDTESVRTTQQPLTWHITWSASPNDE